MRNNRNSLIVLVLVLSIVCVCINCRKFKVRADNCTGDKYMKELSSIECAYEVMQQEEEYVVKMVNKLSGMNLTTENWVQCLKYINSNWEYIKSVRAIDLEKFASYKQDYESVYRMNNDIKLNIVRRNNNVVYNPSKCRQYIEKYWNGKNKDFSYYEGKDCANFASQCLNIYGYPMDNIWYSKNKQSSVAWINAQMLTEHFSNTNKYIESSTAQFYTNFNKHLKKVKNFDLICLRNKQNRVYHVMLVSAVTENDILYTGHTNDRIDFSLKNVVKESKENIRIVSTGR